MFNVGRGVVNPGVVTSSVVCFSATDSVSFAVVGTTSSCTIWRRRVTFRCRVVSSNLRCRCCRASRLAVRAICPPVRVVSPNTTDVSAMTIAHIVSAICCSRIVTSTSSTPGYITYCCVCHNATRMQRRFPRYRRSYIYCMSVFIWLLLVLVNRKTRWHCVASYLFEITKVTTATLWISVPPHPGLAIMHVPYRWPQEQIHKKHRQQ